MVHRPTWPPPYTPYRAEAPPVADQTAILIELSRIAGDVREARLETRAEFRALDSRLETMDTRVGNLEKQMDTIPRRRKQKFFVPWIDLGWAVAAWIPGIAMIVLIYFGQNEMAQSIASLFNGPSR
jgi:hypothetical protein